MFPTQAGSGSSFVVDLTLNHADHADDTDGTDDEEGDVFIEAIRDATRRYKTNAHAAAARQLASVAAHQLASAAAAAAAVAEAASLRQQLAEAEVNLRKESADAADKGRQLAECQARLKAQAATGATALEALLGVAVAGVCQPGAAVPWTAAGGGAGGINDVLDWANRTCCGADEAKVVGQVVSIIKGQKEPDLLNQYVNFTLPRVTSSPLATALLKLAKGKKIGCN
jgi:hypothetical protein